MSNPEAPPSTGLVGGKYQLVRMIGRGGMGSVWEARHASLGTPAAIKFIEAEYANSEEARSRFDKEAKAAATIQSKHAIQIYDHGVTDDGKPYIVMELLTGEPLDKRIERLGRLSLVDTAHIIRQVSRGLARAHERGIVHRDLKPENIFIVRNTDDDEEVAKVLDFGIAKIQSSPHSPGISSTTKTGAVLGTPFYMSPEQARGLRNVDHRTDVWSLGVIAFKCVSGQLPFDGESVGDLLVKICTSPVPVPSHLVAGLPPAFDAWFLRALERDPERRFGTVHELAEQLAYAAGLGRAGPHRMPDPSSATVPLPASAVSSVVYSGGVPINPNTPMSGTGPHAASMGARTPHPGGMTASPLTTSGTVPSGPAATWKWVVGSAALGLAVAGIGTGVAVAVRHRDSASANNVGVGVTQPPPRTDTAGATPAPSAGASATASASAPATSATAPPAIAEGAPAAKGAGAKSLTASAPAKPVVAGKPSAPSAPPRGPTARPATLPAPGALPAPPPPPPTPLAPPPPPPKKANKNDPGY